MQATTAANPWGYAGEEKEIQSGATDGDCWSWTKWGCHVGGGVEFRWS